MIIAFIAGYLINDNDFYLMIKGFYLLDSQLIVESFHHIFL